MAQLHASVRAAIVDFAYTLGNGTLDAGGLLHGVDYRGDFQKNPNELQLVFAVYTNVLRVDDDGKVVNAAEAAQRAAAVVRRYHQPSFVIQPPLSDAEIAHG